MVNEEKIFFLPGDLCKVKHDLDNVPIMYVTEKISRTMMTKEGNKENTFLGIKCRWFDAEYKLQEAVFSTKDLIHIE